MAADLMERLLALPADERREILHRSRKPRSETAVAAERPRRFRALPTQHAQWFLWRLAPANAAHHVPMCYDVRGPLDLRILRRSLECVVARHEMLRTTFEVDGTDLFQVVGDPAPVEIGYDVAADRVEALDLLNRQADLPFDLSTGPLFRVHVCRYAPQRYLLLIVFHHVAIDEHGSAVLESELGQAYTAITATGELPVLPLLSAQCGDVAERATAEDLDEGVRYWAGALAGGASVALPTDRPAGARLVLPGAVLRQSLPYGASEALRSLAAARGVTRFAAVAAAFARFLGRYTEASDVVFGTPVSCREQEGADRLIGYFLNTLPIRLPADPDLPYGDAVTAAHHTLNHGLRRRDVPFARMVEAVGGARGPFDNPLFDTMLTFLPVESVGRTLSLNSSLVIESTVLPLSGGVPYVSFTVLDRDDELELAVRYPVDQYEESTMRGYAVEFAELLAELCGEQHQPQHSPTDRTETR
ncbi:condensation domain protein [Kribbella flavida DSM 17836]|uniref:Condensation domain protein n=1 Tax=Kribbella flavida (strain DSM 17836 / JCM 10339 / NBRC 14399) TaxID=479435 RepID=D2PSM3_KRIFD|nr:condensation domain-containing protein [Kribbella flavida]ADB33161.1 condensation domain protein [Kribbella flavida DSM 17836]